MKLFVDKTGLAIDADATALGFVEGTRPWGLLRNLTRISWAEIDALEFEPAHPSFSIRMLDGTERAFAPHGLSWTRARPEHEELHRCFVALAICAWENGANIGPGWLAEPIVEWRPTHALPANSGPFREAPGQLLIQPLDGTNIEYRLHGTTLYRAEGGVALSAELQSNSSEEKLVRASSFGSPPHFVLGRWLHIDLPDDDSGPVSDQLRAWSKAARDTGPTMVFLRAAKGRHLARHVASNFSKEFAIASQNDLDRELRARGIDPSNMRSRHRRGYQRVLDWIDTYGLDANRPANVRLSPADVDSNWQVHRTLIATPPSLPEMPGCRCHDLTGPDDVAKGLRPCMAWIGEPIQEPGRPAICGETGLVFRVYFYDDRGVDYVAYQLAEQSYPDLVALVDAGTVRAHAGFVDKARAYTGSSRNEK